MFLTDSHNRVLNSQRLRLIPPLFFSGKEAANSFNRDGSFLGNKRATKEAFQASEVNISKHCTNDSTIFPNIASTFLAMSTEGRKGNFLIR